MARLDFKSPGVSTREIDLSGPTRVSPSGIPAGVIGTSVKGRAFVPITFATFQDFVAEFGSTDGAKFAPLAINEWMKNARAGTFTKILGVGDGKARRTTDSATGAPGGRVNRAGFIVGSQQVQSNGIVGANASAGVISNGNSGVLGKTFFLASLMTPQGTSTLFSDANIAASAGDALPILRGVLMSPSGVALTLSSSLGNDVGVSNTAISATPAKLKVAGSTNAANNGGGAIGIVKTVAGDPTFVMLLNGHAKNDQYPNTITCSFDPTSPQYISKVLNTDPTKIEKAGHLLYSHYDINPSLATVTGSRKALTHPVATDRTRFIVGHEQAALLVSSSLASNKGSATIPNYENFEDRYKAAKTPFFISQKFGVSNKNLFRVHALDDGAVGNDTFKITIENIQSSNNENNKYGQFDLVVRQFTDSDENPVVLEAYRGLSLDPGSDRYISRVVGDQNAFYDFDQAEGAQKLRIDGVHPNVSKYIRIEVADDVTKARIDASALPVGFRGVPHLVTSGSAIMHLSQSINDGFTLDYARKVVQPPVPFRETLHQGSVPKKRVNAALCWGVQFELKDSIANPNRNQVLDPSIASFTKYFPDFTTTQQKVLVGNNEGTADSAGTVLDADKFNNNMFTLERIQVSTGSDDRPIIGRWAAAQYRRNGVEAATLTLEDGSTVSSDSTRFLDPTKDFNHAPSKKYLKFNCLLQGGFDGLNSFDVEKAELSNLAVKREMDDSVNQGGTSGPSVVAFRKAIDIMEEKSDVDIQLLAIPGIRHESVTDFAIDSVETRFDALYIMDIEERDTSNNIVTGSTQLIDVTNTVAGFEGRNLNSSFAAAYFPDVVITDPTTQTNVRCAPSVAVLGAFSRNDALSHPWFAPAGFARGTLQSVEEVQVKLKRANMDSLYEADINPITTFPQGGGPVIFGQKTLLAAQSALDRVNVRRLLIDVRRKVRVVANTILFEPNRESTLARFSSAVSPILQRIQANQGLDRFKVQIDTSTTTQADVENNTIRGKIFLQPTRALEFIALDFVVTNQGAEI